MPVEQVLNHPGLALIALAIGLSALAWTLRRSLTILGFVVLALAMSMFLPGPRGLATHSLKIDGITPKISCLRVGVTDKNVLLNRVSPQSLIPCAAGADAPGAPRKPVAGAARKERPGSSAPRDRVREFAGEVERAASGRER